MTNFTVPHDVTHMIPPLVIEALESSDYEFNFWLKNYALNMRKPPHIISLFKDTVCNYSNPNPEMQRWMFICLIQCLYEYGSAKGSSTFDWEDVDPFFNFFLEASKANSHNCIIRTTEQANQVEALERSLNIS